METVSVRDLRNRLAELVDAAQRGETVAITRRGEIIACLGPVLTERRRLPDLSGFRSSIHSPGTPLSHLVVDSREAERF